MRVLVCGGSRYRNKVALYDRLDRLHAQTRILLLMNGGARGADYLASQWARERGVPLQVYRADRQRFGDDAFLVLNAEMLETGRPDLVLAFPGGTVTADLIARAQAACIRVEHVPEGGQAAG